MARSNLTEGMVVDGDGMGDCSACQKGKQTRSPILCTTHDCKSKDDTLGVFKAWKASAEKEMGKSLKILCTDGRGEYTSSTFNTYLAEHGIKHEVTNAYTPQENGVSECANQTINNLAHSMMADVKEVLKSKSLPLSLWSQAI